MIFYYFQINTNQGRYVLTSTGDLQIVQLHRTDSGTYVCIADNGVGDEVTREVVLDVAGMIFFFIVCELIFYVGAGRILSF